MSLITQYSRISHHTITPSGTTFTVPSQEDFTSSTSPWTTTDLALSEFGVNEADNKLYVRIGTHINEVFLNGNELTFTGTPNQVIYYDANGSVSSDSGFTHSITGGTLFYIKPESDIQYGLLNGQLFSDTGTTGSGLFYFDSSGGKNYQNFVGAMENIDGGDFENISALLWQDQGISQNQSLILASHFSGNPVIVLQAQSYTDTGYTTTYAGFVSLTNSESRFGFMSGSTFTGLRSEANGNQLIFGDTYLYNDLHTSRILSGNTELSQIFVQQASGLTGSYTVGSNTLTLVNGLITGIA